MLGLAFAAIAFAAGASAARDGVDPTFPTQDQYDRARAAVYPYETSAPAGRDTTLPSELTEELEWLKQRLPAGMVRVRPGTSFCPSYALECVEAIVTPAGMHWNVQPGRRRGLAGWVPSMSQTERTRADYEVVLRVVIMQGYPHARKPAVAVVDYNGITTDEAARLEQALQVISQSRNVERKVKAMAERVYQFITDPYDQLRIRLLSYSDAILAIVFVYLIFQYMQLKTYQLRPNN
ncbi:unnamed protein product (mitochondrion) [Plasmodiophora brassicae]|uniref:GOLD domain-containing protein n=1 Tax=Plasmodiophora brassicae TaxID=37360 RepID=A0A3P3YIW6_PLABS|nr:unnamed protein product [Plasmodiophora brassicae]